MATNDCIPVEFLIPSEDGFFFTGVETVAGLDVDSLGMGSVCLLEYCILNNEKKIVILNTDGCFEAQHLSLEQQRQNASKFNVQFYNVDNADDNEECGRPVILYTTKDGNLLVVSCNERGEIRPEKMDQLPNDIKGNQHKAVFYRKQISSSKYHLQCSLDKSKFLGFESIDMDGSSVLKLALLPWRDEVDTRIEVFMSKFQ